MPRQIQGSQTDFSYGEIDVALKRNDSHPARKAGLRQMSNARILNSGALQNRSGRRALFPVPAAYRTEKVTMSPGNDFSVSFGVATMSIFNSAGVRVANFTNQGNGVLLPWSIDTIGQIIYAQMGLAIYFTFPGMRPQVVSWDGVSAWSIADYAELIVGGVQKRTPFYRISPQGITLAPSAQNGIITLTASAPLFTAAHIGTRMRYVGRQMIITNVTNPLVAGASVQESLPGSQALTFASDPRLLFSIGDSVRGATSGAVGLVTATNATTINVQLMNNAQQTITNQLGVNEIFGFVAAETVVGPGGALDASTASVINPPVAVTVWDDEVMNLMRGYPASCFVDQFRLGFCDFPAVPGGISWSSINSPTDLFVVGATLPSGGIFEITPDKSRVLYVVPGPESAEFVFTNKNLYYIKIDASNPLRPGSVGFQLLSGDGCAKVQPRVSQSLILYVNAGLNSVMAITAAGAYYRPFNTANLCEFHGHLFSSIVAIAVPTADGTFNERYAYVLNLDGTIVVGKYTIKEGQVAATIGWGPWTGAGAVNWVAAFAGDVLFTTTYFGNFTMCEVLDDSQYLDGSVSVNNLPAAMAAPPSKGPLWWAPLQSVSLMDQITRAMGTYQIDGNGFIVPQFNGGEDLTATTLVAGLPWTLTVEPFAPDAQSGADMGQRMKLRQIGNFAVYVINSTGFLFALLFSAKQTRTSPALGTMIRSSRVPMWNVDDDATLPPTERETVELWPPSGSSFDPRVAIIKDTPGPLLIAEIGMEVTI